MKKKQVKLTDMLVTVNVKKAVKKITKEEKKNKKPMVQSTILDWRIQPGSRVANNLVCLPGVEVAEPRLEDKVEEPKEKTKVFEVPMKEVEAREAACAQQQQQQLSDSSPPAPRSETERTTMTP